MKTWKDTLKKVTAAGIDRIIIMGPPGTGKSTAPNTIWEPENVHRVQCTPGMERADLLGGMGLRDGNTVQVEGPVVKAMRTGGVLVMDEIDRIPPELHSLVQSILDPANLSAITLSDGSVLRPSTGYKVIGTTNCASPMDEFPATIWERFQVCIVASEPLKEQLESLPENVRPIVEKHYASQTWQWSATVSFRRVASYAALAEKLSDQELAAELTFGQSAKEFLSAIVSAAQ